MVSLFRQFIVRRAERRKASFLAWQGMERRIAERRNEAYLQKKLTTNREGLAFTQQNNFSKKTA